MAKDRDTIDLFDLIGKEFGDVLVCRPVDGYAEFISVDFLEFLLEIGALKPIVAKPIEVGKLLIRQLIEFSVRGSRKRLTDKIVDIEGRQGDVFAFTAHPVGQVDDVSIPKMRTDKIGVIDVGIVDILAWTATGPAVFR